MTRIIPKYDDYPMIGRVRLDPELALANTDPILIRRGLVSGASVVQKFGRNPSVPNGSWEGVLQVAAQFPWLTAASTIQVRAGGDAADTAAGAGAQTVTVEGLDATGVEVSETLTLAGASASAASTTEFFRVFRAFVGDAGAYTGTNTGDIVIETTGGTALIQITAEEGQTQFCGYTIPAGKVGLLTGVVVQVDAAKAADFRLFTRADAMNTTAPFQPRRLKFYWDGVLGVSAIQPRTPLLSMPALTDVWVEAKGSAITEVTADMEIILFDV